MIAEYLVWTIRIAAMSGVPYALLKLINHESRLTRFFRSSGIKNNRGEVPLLHKKSRQDWGYRYTFKLPYGLSVDNFTDKGAELKAYFNGDIKMQDEDNMFVTMDVLTAKLKAKYPFDIGIDVPGAVAFPVGIGKKGIVTLKLCEDHPNVLIGGTTQSGKSMLLRAIITYLCIKKPAVILHLIDLKGTEFHLFEGIKNAQDVIVGDRVLDALQAVKTLINDMYRRNKIFREHGVSNIYEYNVIKGIKPMLYHVVIIDEFKNLSSGEYEDEANMLIDKLVRLSAASGIYTILSTQRPDSQTVVGGIKANLAVSIAFKTKTEKNSEIILDHGGAEKLRGKGNGIISTGIEEEEFQGFLLTTEQARELLAPLKGDNKKEIKEDLTGVWKE